MRVSIIGAGRRRSGIGEYIAKYFHKNGAQVVSVLGRSEESSLEASRNLQKYGIRASPYTDLREMVDGEHPDVVVIASPSPTHYHYLEKAVDSGVHVFCEKPFLHPDLDDINKKAETLIRQARENRLTLAMNSQWPFALKHYERICGPVDIKKSSRFFISLSPATSGREMIPEAVPHALSLLYCKLGEGEIKNLTFHFPKEEEMVIRFSYVFKKKDCDVLIRLTKREEQPREFRFGFNDKVVTRSLNLKNYDIYFNYGVRKLKITDPLDLSVRDFMKAVGKKSEPLIGCSHILRTTFLLKGIYDQSPTKPSPERREDSRGDDF